MVTTNNGPASSPEPPDELLWNIKTVILKTGLSRPSIYRYMKRGRFPPHRRIGPNRVAWVASDILAWIETCPCARTVRPEQGAGVRDGVRADAPSFGPAMAARNQS